MALPFHITCTFDAVPLFELDDSRFQMIKRGAVAPLMAGHRYLIVEYALASYLESMDLHGIRIAPVSILDRSTDTEHRSYKRIFVSQFFRASEIHDLNLDGPRLLTLNDTYVFCSPDMRAVLEDGGFEYLRFSEGLTGFAANAL